MPEMPQMPQRDNSGLRNAMAGLMVKSLKKGDDEDMNSRAEKIMHPQGPLSTPTEVPNMELTPRRKVGDLAGALAGLGGLA